MSLKRVIWRSAARQRTLKAGSVPYFSPTELTGKGLPLTSPPVIHMSKTTHSRSLIKSKYYLVPSAQDIMLVSQEAIVISRSRLPPEFSTIHRQDCKAISWTRNSALDGLIPMTSCKQEGNHPM